MKPYEGSIMFQCDGPCKKWVHPSCFGETEATIKGYLEKDMNYYCYFCRPDKDCCEKETIMYI